MKRKLFTLALFAFLIVLILPCTAIAADFSVSSDTDLSSLSLTSGDTITVQSGSDIKLYSSNSSFNYNIGIICESNAAITIENINIISTTQCALTFQGGNNTLVISGTNNMQSSASNPGIKVEDSTILTISGTGTLTARGGSHGAGIGGSENVGAVTSEASRINAGTINILSGTINAYGGRYAAGIGGGEQGHGGNINISGGTIYAQGNTSGAGIGGGAVAKSGIINISGGTITAQGSTSGAGIGAGSLFAVEEINISGGTITAYGGSYSAAIGGGSQSAGGKINISGGTITAQGRYRGTAIGGGYYTDCGTIKITDGNIRATISSGAYSAAIGTSQFGRGGNIIIEGGNIYASGGSYGGAGIGSGRQSSSTADELTSIEISGGTVEARARYAAAIGGGRYVSNAGEIKLTGGLIITDTYPSSYNDIGACTNSYAGSVNISGDAALFIQDNTSSTIVTSTHSYYNDETYVSGSAYGYSLPSYYSGKAYAWLPAIPVTYVAGENGSIVVDDVSAKDSFAGTDYSKKKKEKVLKGYCPKNAPATLANEGYVFKGWSNDTITTKNLNKFIIDAPTTLTAVFAPISVDGVTIDIDSATLVLGDLNPANNIIQLAATVTPDNAGNKNITWSSNDTSIATVDNTGLVTAVSSGVTTITVTTEDGGHTATSTITVIQHVTDVTLDKHNEIYYKNDVDTLTCDVVPYDAFDRTVTWHCDNPNVLTYTVVDDSTIEFTAVGPGSAHVTVTTNDMGYQDTFTINVHNPDNDPNSSKAGLSCELVDSTGAGVPDYKFTLYSDPIWALTDAVGKVTFDNIAYDYHTLTIKDSSGVEIRRYDLVFSAGSQTGYSISGGDISLTYTGYTKNIHLLFDISDPGSNISLIDAEFTVINPSTGDDSTWFERVIRFIKGLFS